MLSDRLFFGLAAVIAIATIALALVWPQGLGARSPGPFGHPLAPIAPAAADPQAPGLRSPAPAGSAGAPPAEAAAPLPARP